MTRVLCVDSIDLTLQKSNPPLLHLTAQGRVSSIGWSNIRLEPFVCVVPPADGVQDCDMVGTPPAPGMIVMPVITPVIADLVVGRSITTGAPAWR